MIKNIMQYSIFFYSIMCVNSIKASQVKMPNLLAAGVIPVICYDNGNTTVILGLEKDNEWVQNPYIDAFSGASGFGDSNPLNLAMREFDEEARLCYTVPALNSNIQFLKDNIHTIVISLINDVTFGEKQYGVTYFVKIKPDHKERLFANFESSTQTIKQELSGPSQKSQKDALLEKEALFEFSYPEILESACSSKERKALPQFHSTTQKQASLQSKEIGLRDSLVFILSAIKSENIWDRSSYGVYIIGQTKKIIDNYGAARYTPWNPDKGLKELVYNEVMQDFAIPQQPNAKKTITDTVTSSDFGEGDSKKSLMIAKEHYKNPLEAVSSLKEDTPAGELKIDQPKINESQQDESEEKKDAESKSGIADSTEQPKKEIVNNVFTKNNLFLFIGSGIGLSVFAYLVYHSGIIGKWR